MKRKTIAAICAAVAVIMPFLTPLSGKCAALDPIGTEEPAGENVPSADQKTLSLRMTLSDGTALTVILEDHSAVRSLLAQLPLTLTFSDYAGTEKIAYPPEKLDVSGAPTRCDPDAGTLAYYAPWGNVCIFYRDFAMSEHLVPLGKIDQDRDILAAMHGDFTVTLEAIAP